MSRMFSRASGSHLSPLRHYMHRKEAEVKAMFDVLDMNKKGFLTVDVLLNLVRAAGLDPDKITSLKKEISVLPNEKGEISFLRFSDLITREPTLLQRTISGNLAIPSFMEFCEQLVQIFEDVKKDNSGNNATYIPELASVDPNMFAFAICTVDGQQFSYGNSEEDFCLQSCSNPFMYCAACQELGVKKVHEFVGNEPSGKEFNAFTLCRDNKPHNPMINTGAMITHGLVQQNLKMSKRVKFVIEYFSRIAGGAKIGFSQPVYLSEKETANKNFALAYFMKSKGAFPENKDITEELDFYFQICSLSVNCRSLATMAATLAKGGVSPETEERLFDHNTVKHCLQILLSCGMYDFSGEWACTIGLPAKSGVSGSVFVVIPNVMGLALWSPRLDDRGNSYRAIQFCTKMTEKFALNIFDQLIGGVSSKIDPTRPLSFGETNEQNINEFAFISEDDDNVAI